MRSVCYLNKVISRCRIINYSCTNYSHKPMRFVDFFFTFIPLINELNCLILYVSDGSVTNVTNYIWSGTGGSKPAD